MTSLQSYLKSLTKLSGLNLFMFQKALESYLTELADLQVAYDRLHDTTDPIITVGDMRKELEL